MKPEDYEYVVKNNLCLFQKGPLSNWWGGFSYQNGGFKMDWFMITYYANPALHDVKNWVRANYDTREEQYFNCVEQYMMAAKAIISNDVETLEKIMNTTHPAEQKKLGREVKNFDSARWDRIKYDVVHEACVAKFDQNYELEVFLKQFHPLTIFAEASPWDKIWGIGMGPDDPKALDINTWDGKNLLGRVISSIRQNIEFEELD